MSNGLNVVVPTTNVDSQLAAHLLRKFKGYHLRKYWYRRYVDNCTNVYIRPFMSASNINARCEECENPIRVVDCTNTKVVQEELHPGVTYNKVDAPTVSRAVYQALKLDSEPISRVVDLFEDYDTHKQHYEESDPLMLYVALYDPFSEEGCKFYDRLLSGDASFLEECIKEGKRIKSFFASIHDELAKELVVKTDHFYAYANGIEGNRILPEYPCKVCYVASEKGCRLILYLSNEVTDEDKKRIQSDYAEYIDELTTQSTCFYGIDLSKIPTDVEGMGEIDYSKIVVKTDDAHTCVREYVIRVLASTRRNEVHVGDTLYVNTQYVFREIVDNYFLRDIETLVLYVRRKDGKFRTVTYHRDTFTDCGPGDVKIVEHMPPAVTAVWEGKSDDPWNK